MDYIESNVVLKKLPKHLKQYIVDQHYENYTPVDHAVWRYVMRQNVNYLKKVAHESYLNGLMKTGIGIEQIPGIYEMNKILAQIGWAAVTVDGFIPPAAFMEFQAYHVLVIAADIRQIGHIEYTPAPDIIHEAAGHAPIIADPEYARYLIEFGRIGSKAIPSQMDQKLYEAVRHLSIIKENPETKEDAINIAEEKIKNIQQDMGEPSEMTEIRRLHWWTVEYGLVGNIENPRIYGAGLLSSISESVSCLKDEVKKLPLNLDTVNYEFDITKPQPQLFVTPDFKHLNKILTEFTNTMAQCTGGVSGVTKAKESGTVTTCEYSSGLQVSGVLHDYISDVNGNLAYIMIKGPASLAHNYSELKGHNKKYHSDGFSSPVGKLISSDVPLEQMTNSEMNNLGLIQGEISEFNFTSGVKVKGIIKNMIRNENGHIILITLEEAYVNYQGKELFSPEWGIYDMAIGEEIKSVFSGAADKENYESVGNPDLEKTPEINYSQSMQNLHSLYGKVRKIRTSQKNYDEFPEIWEQLISAYPEDWLLSLEILELIQNLNLYPEIQTQITDFHNKLKRKNKCLDKLIQDGLNLLG